METVEWMRDLKSKFRSKVSHFFLLYLNVSDAFHFGEELQDLDLYLFSAGPASSNGLVVYFNRGTGIRCADSKKAKQFREFLKATDASLFDLYVKAGNRVPAMTQIFDFLLRIRWDTKDPKAQNVLKQVFGDDYAKNSGQPFFTAVIQYAETIVPPDASHHDKEDRDALVSFQVWAKSQAIRNANNLVILTAENLSAVAPALRSEMNEITPIKIPFPSQSEREVTILKTYKKLGLAFDDLESIRRLADLSAGLTNKIIAKLIQEAKENKRTLDSEAIFQAKKKFLEEQAGSLLEIMKPVWGLEAIGSLEEHKLYILEVVKAMKEKNAAAVPMAILLVGPPGVGKTVYAEALAYLSGIPMVKFKNTREMWVGQSERNLDFSLEIIKAYSPVIVFIDEIEQHFQIRGAVQGDSGVNARMQARLFEFMSDTNLRGRILWIAATNRPDLLDPALLREGRFDEKIPFFLPVAEERPKILKAILAKKKAQAKAVNSDFCWDLSEGEIEKFGWQAHHHYDSEEGLTRCSEESHPFGKESKDEVTLTGAEIEVIVTKAYMVAKRSGSVLNFGSLEEALLDYLPNRNQRLYEEMVDLALLYCSSKRFLSETLQERARQLRTKRSGSKRIDL